MTSVVVLAGGRSREREVSLVTGAAFMRALSEKGYDRRLIDTGEDDWISLLVEARPDIVLNGLHGPLGEDGCVQGVLECLGIAYSHSGVCASALAMDKERTKQFARLFDLDVPAGIAMDGSRVATQTQIAPPLVIKPRSDGSSFGVVILRDEAAWEAYCAAPTVMGEVLVEEFIAGRELTVAVMGSRGALAVTEILTDRGFYDYEAKYAAGGSRHVVAPDLPPGIAEKAMTMAETIYVALGCRGIARADFLFDEHKGRLSLLEVNTQPGMTPTSLAPEQAAHCGIGFADLVAWMVEDASCPR